MAQLSQSVDTSEFRGYASMVAQNWATRDPAAAAAWVMSLNEPTARSAAIGSMVSTWASDQPDVAAAWVMGLPSGSDRTGALYQLGRSWASFDPVNAADWLLAQNPPSPSLDSAIQGLASTVMQSNPQGAMAWAGSISNPTQRNTLMEQAGRLWMRRDPERAAAFIANSSLPASTRRRLLGGR